MKLTVRVDSSQFDESIGNLMDTLDAAVTTKLRAMAAETKELAQELVPVQTGRLRRGIRYRVRRGNVTFTASAINPINGYDYAYDQHERQDYQHKVGESHFIFKALQQTVPKFIEEVQEDIHG